MTWADDGADDGPWTQDSVPMVGSDLLHAQAACPLFRGGRLLQPCAKRNLFEESRQDRRAVRQGCGQQHAVRFEAPHLARSKIGDDHNLAPNQLFRLIMLRDAGQNLALFVAEIDFKAQQFVGLRNPLGDENLRHAEIDLGEVVNADHRR